MKRMFERLVAGAFALPVLAAQTAPIAVHDAVFPFEADADADYKLIEPIDEERRPIFVLLGPSAATDARTSERGRAYMLAREAGFYAVRPRAAAETRPAYLLVEGAPPCRLRVINQLVLLSNGEPATDALQAEGCATPTSRYGAQVVLGRFDQVRWIETAPVSDVPALVLQEIPKGVSPDSPLAKTVIPEINRRRIAEHDAAVRDAARRRAADDAAMQARGGMRDDDDRLRPFLTAAAADARLRGFKPDLFIAADRAYVHFTDGYHRACLMSLDARGKPRIEGL